MHINANPRIWVPAHEIGHCMGSYHHNWNGMDDIVGAIGHDCIMTQALFGNPGGLNPLGQSTKRFGPECVYDLRNYTDPIYNTLE